MRYLPALALLCCLVCPALAKPLPADRILEPELLTPYFSVLADPQGKLTYEGIFSPNPEERFSPLHGGFPVKASGPVWLRLVLIRAIAPGAPGYTPAHLVLDMGELPPGITRIYLPAEAGLPGAGGAVTGETVVPHEKILLPEPGITPVSVYIRMEETPGLWFSPVVGPSPLASGDFFPVELIFLGLIPAAAALCLLRAVKDRAVWPLWVALFLGCVLIQDVLPLPGAGSPFKPADLPVLLAPGLGLMILAHLGRVLLQTKKRSPGADLFLICGLFPGVALCLLPLVPGLSWLTRLFPLWALPALLFLPVGLAGLARKQSGSLGYTGACFFAVAGAVCTLAALFLPLPPLAASAWLWGLAAAGVCLTLAGSPRDDAADAETADAEDAVLHNLPPLQMDAFSRGVGSPAPAAPADAPLSLGGPARPAVPAALDLDMDAPAPKPAEPPAFADPALEFAQPPAFADPALEFAPARPVTPVEPVLDLTPVFPAAPSLDFDVTEAFRPDEREEPAAASPPVSETPLPAGPERIAVEEPAPPASFFAEAEPFEEPEPLPAPSPEEEFFQEIPAEREEVPAPKVVRSPSPADPTVISLKDEDFSAYTLDGLSTPPPSAEARNRPGAAAYIFNPQSLVREVHASVEKTATSKGLLLSWFVAPTVPPLLEGDAPNLRQALFLLMQNAVQASRRGAVQVTVRQSRETGDDDEFCPLLFSVSDNGSDRRTDAGFFQAWELASLSGGSFRVQYQPGSGTTVHFSVRFRRPTEEQIQAHYEELGAPIEPDQASVVSEPVGALAEMIADLLPSMPSRPEPDSGLPGVILAETTAGNKKLLGHYLKEYPVESASAQRPEQAQELYAARPARLVIFDADMPESDTAAAIAAIRRLESERSLPPTAIMALVGHEAQIDRMRALGCSSELHKPFGPDSLRKALAAALPDIVTAPEPAPAAELADAPPPQREDLEDRLERLILSPDFLPDSPPAASRRPAPEPAQAPAAPPVEPRPEPVFNLRPITLRILDPAQPPSETAQPRPAPEATPSLFNLSPEDVTPPAPAAAEPATPVPSVRKDDVPLLDLIITEDADEPEPAPLPTPSPAPKRTRPPGMALVGLDESVQLDMLPLVPGLIHSLRDALRLCAQGLADGGSVFVQEAAGHLAEQAESFGLEKLGKIARCVERAAEADDLEAVRTLLDDLNGVTLRYAAALQETYDTYIKGAPSA